MPTIFEPDATVTALWLALGAPGAQTSGEFFAELALGLHEDGLVDRFMRHPPLWLIGVVSA